MKHYLKYICASFLILMSGVMSAQDDECITLDVNFAIDAPGTVDMTGNAVISFQDRGFMMTGNGVEAYCDGSSVWTLDIVAKEVYIESLTAASDAYLQQLRSKLSSSKAGADLSFISPEGLQVNVRINSIRKSAGKDISSFRPAYDFDSSWVVTDLR